MEREAERPQGNLGRVFALEWNTKDETHRVIVNLQCEKIVKMQFAVIVLMKLKNFGSGSTFRLQGDGTTRIVFASHGERDKLSLMRPHNGDI